MVISVKRPFWVNRVASTVLHSLPVRPDGWTFSVPASVSQKGEDRNRALRVFRMDRPAIYI
jgi:hypothetical protein